MNLQTALSRFLVQIKADGRSTNTIKQYRRHVYTFGAWLPTVARAGPHSGMAA